MVAAHRDPLKHDWRAKKWWGKGTYAPAFGERDLAESLAHSDHLVFNSPAQIRRHLHSIYNCLRPIEIALRLNPEYAEVDVDLYNPSSSLTVGQHTANYRSRSRIIQELDGLHLHALCEQVLDTFANVVAALEERFDDLIAQVKWLNLGGGHWHQAGHDREALITIIEGLLQRYPNLTNIYLEPGEAWAVDTGVLQAAGREDISDNGMPLAILDVSVTAHMPDVLEMLLSPHHSRCW